MNRAILIALFAFAACGADANTFYAAPGGGASASCVDSGANVCTVNRCLAGAITANGDTCVLAPGTYPGSELGASGYIMETSKFVTLECSGAKGSCILQPTGANVSGIRLNSPVAGGTMTVKKITIDGSLATPLDQCFYASDATGIYSLVLEDTDCREANIYGVRVVANELNLTMSNNDMSASSAVTPTHYVGTVGTWVEGSVVIDGGNVTIAKYNGESPSAVVRITAADAGETASVKNLNIDITNDPAKTSKNLDVITVTNIPNAVIQGNTITVHGANVGATGPACDSSVCRQVRVARCYSTGAYSSAGCSITDNVLSVEAANGQMIAIGYDQTSAGDGQSGSGLIADNDVTCVADATSMHGVGVFWSQGGKVTRNEIRNCGIGMLSKDQPTNGADFYANVVWGAWEEYAYAKGTTAPGFFNNALIVTNASGTPLLVGLDGGSNSTNVEFKNNLIWAPGGITPTNLVKTASSQTIAAGGATANDWYGFSAYQWTYLGSAYTTLATWNALSAVGTDTSADPGLLKSSPTEVSHLMPKAGSPLLRAGVCYLTGNCAYPDFRGHRSRVPPDVGVYQRSPSD